jgi:hypothetical protein
VQDVRAKLPGPAHSLYYKDLIGNISSSNTVHTTKQVRNQAAAAAASAIWQQQQQSLGFPLQQQPRAAELQAPVPSLT